MKSTPYGATVALAVAGILAVTMSAANAREPQASPNDGTAPAAAADPSAVATRVDAAQRQAVLINQIASRFQGEAASQFHGSFDAVEWRLAFGARLFYQPESALAAALSSPDITAMNAGLARGVSSKHLGGQNNTVQLLSSPCRIVDTRFGGGGMLGPVPRAWYASNTPAVIAAQGGNGAGCGTFPNAEFFLVYVTVVPPGVFGSGGASFLTLQHDGTVPTTATMNFYPGLNLAEFAAPSCNGCAGVSVGGFYGYAASPTHVVIDLVGIGQPAPAPLAAIFDCVNTGFPSHAIGANSNTYFVNPACPAGYQPTLPYCYTPAQGVYSQGSGHVNDGETAQTFCAWHNTTGSSQTVYGGGVCCRVPGA